MRRALLILCGLIALAAFLATTAAGDGEGDDGNEYLVRAYFDNAGFLVVDSDVRIAGATVGSVKEVDVAGVDEVVTEDGETEPGKAVVVMQIEEPGFQGFLTDASCLIRPQSLLGERYVECDPTKPRAPGSPPPPELEQIPDGEVGEGQYFLPIENNGKGVDLDLVNNITRESESDRFRLILNDLGAGLAARGEDLAEVIRRANPALQQTDRVLATLAKQNRQLAQLAADSDAILAPLARERENISGFIRNASIAGQAAAERSADISLGFQRFPAALRELELTMGELRRFALQIGPVADNLREAAPGLTGATRALGPFARAATPALLSLGDAAAASADDLAASEPVIRDLRILGEATTPGMKALKRLLGTFRKTGGIDELMAFVLNTSNVFNGFDDYGHYLRTQLQITNCVEFVLGPRPGAPSSGCEANWADSLTAAAFSGPAPEPTRETLRGTGYDDPVATEEDAEEEPTDAPGEDSGSLDPDGASDEAKPRPDGADDLLEFLVGEE